MNKKITIVSTSDRGGAGKAATRLHKGLLEIGADSNILYLIQYDKTTPNSHEYISENGKVNELIRKAKLGLRYYTNKLSLKGREFDQEIFTYIDTPFDISDHELIKNADVINLHWVSHFLDWKSFFKKVDKPIYWTLHDQNVFTGGCHIVLDCEKYKSNCKQCPQLKGALFNKTSATQFIKKNEITHKKNIKIITPSNWLNGLSKKSLINKDKEHFVINNGMDTNTFKQLNKEICRDELDLPKNKKLLLFILDDPTRKYKGFDLLKNVLKKIMIEDLELVCIGNGNFELENIKVHNMGFISDSEMMNKIYCAADCFVTPSLSDNFPNTIIESFLSGTPIIGFPIGGIKEMIIHGENGILAESVSEDSLINSIIEFLENKFQFNNNIIRENAINSYSIEKMASNYLKIF